MVNRRRFITGSFQLAVGLSLSTYLGPVRSKGFLAQADEILEPNIYLQILPNNEVHFWIKKAEMGQQVHTALTQIAMDELGANLSQVTVHMAQTISPFNNIFTGASWSIPGHWLPLRQLMANARFLLQTAAGQIWGCSAEECISNSGEIRHYNKRLRLSFGQLVGVARTIAIPDKAPLREAKEYQFIGKNMGRIDGHLIVQGKAQYTGDLLLPNLQHATITYPPLPGYRVAGVDSSRLDALPELKKSIKILSLQDAVAIVAERQWPVLEARDKVDVNWQSSDNTVVTDELLQNLMEQALATPGVICRQEESNTKNVGTTSFSADYFMPFAAHVPMEPPVAIARVDEKRAEVWAPTQTASEAQREIARLLNIQPENVVVHTMLIGGGFGRKLKNDYVLDAVRIAQQMNCPVKLQWTRENDIQNGYFRPYGKDRVKVWLDDLGYPTELNIKSASPSIIAKSDHQYFKDGLDWSAVMGLRSIPYHIPNMQLSHQIIDLPRINVVAWRGTFANHHCFAIESMIDELAHLAGIDPLDYRLHLLQKDTKVEHFLDSDILIEHQKLHRVLLKAAEITKWRQRKNLGKKNSGFGIACHCYDTNAYAAHVVEVEVKDKKVRVKKVTCVFDVGIAINPDGVKAQLEGSIVFGLSSALYNEINFENGAIKQSNFHDHAVLRHDEMPTIEIHLFTDGDTPAGAGECGLPSVTPALTNAIFDATGIRVRELPIKLI